MQEGGGYSGIIFGRVASLTDRFNSHHNRRRAYDEIGQSCSNFCLRDVFRISGDSKIMSPRCHRVVFKVAEKAWESSGVLHRCPAVQEAWKCCSQTGPFDRMGKFLRKILYSKATTNSVDVSEKYTHRSPFQWIGCFSGSFRPLKSLEYPPLELAHGYVKRFREFFYEWHFHEEQWYGIQESEDEWIPYIPDR